MHGKLRQKLGTLIRYGCIDKFFTFFSHPATINIIKQGIDLRVRECALQADGLGKLCTPPPLMLFLCYYAVQSVGLSWVQLSAEQNYAPAMVQLGAITLLGSAGVEKDQQKAYTDYFAPAAYAGDQDAQYYIGAAYAGGIAGYKVDPQQAWMWFTLSQQRALLVKDEEDSAQAQGGMQELRATCKAACRTQAKALVRDTIPPAFRHLEEP